MWLAGWLLYEGRGVKMRLTPLCFRAEVWLGGERGIERGRGIDGEIGWEDEMRG